MSAAGGSTAIRMLRSSAVYMFASGASGIVALLLLPVLTRLLSPADFGVLGILLATLGLLSAIIGFNPSLMITARYAISSHEELRELISASGVAALAMGLAAAIALGVVDARLGGGDLPGWVAPAIAAGATFSVFRLLGLTLFQVRHQPLRYAILEITGALLTGALSLVLVWGLGWDWRGKFIADLVGIGTIGAGMVYVLARAGLLGRTSMRAVREFLGYSLPLGIHALAFWAINSQDRYFVAALDGVAAAGVYTVAYTIGAALGLVHTAALRAFNPHFYEQVRGGQAERREIVRITYGYLGVSAIGWLVFIGAVRAVIPVLLGPAFRDSYPLILWVSLGYTFNALRNVMTGYLYVAERTRLIGTLTVAGAVLNALLNILLIPPIGSLGAAIATAVTFAAIALTTTWLAVRSHPMPWRAALNPQPPGQS